MASKLNETKIKSEPVETTQAPESSYKQVSNDIFIQATLDMQKAQRRKKELHKHYMNEDKVPMYLSPQYRNEFGNVMHVSINGIAIYFKVDGSTQFVPKTFADEITRRRMCVDNKLNRLNRMANIMNNYETSAGDIKLF